MVSAIKEQGSYKAVFVARITVAIFYRNGSRAGKTEKSGSLRRVRGSFALGKEILFFISFVETTFYENGPQKSFAESVS